MPIFLEYFFKMPARVGHLFSVIPGGYPPIPTGYHKIFFKTTMAVFIACKARPIKLYLTTHLSPVKCTVKPKAAGFTRIRVCEEPNVAMTQVKALPRTLPSVKTKF
jgi:hypothetical protein